jgi:hypothetical protein
MFSKFRSRVGLLLDHRLGRLLRGYWVCVTMHYLLGAHFRSKDHRSPKSPRGDILPSAYLGPSPLYLHYVGELRSYMFLYDLGARGLAISERRCSAHRSLSDLLPPTRGRGKGLFKVTSS